jgi:hypothetical protein
LWVSPCLAPPFPRRFCGHCFRKTVFWGGSFASTACSPPMLTFCGLALFVLCSLGKEVLQDAQLCVLCKYGSQVIIIPRRYAAGRVGIRPVRMGQQALVVVWDSMAQALRCAPWFARSEPPSNKKYYYNMTTNARQEERPGTGACEADPRPAKRSRPLDPSPSAGVPPVAATTPTSTSVASPMDAASKPIDVPPARKVSHFPPVAPDHCPIRAGKEYFTKRFPEERPMVRRVQDPSLFREEHSYLLEQLVRDNMERVFDVGMPSPPPHAEPLFALFCGS